MGQQIDDGNFKAMREISFSAMFRKKLRNMTDQQRNISFNNVGDPGRSARFLSTYEHGTDSPYVLYAVASFEKMFKCHVVVAQRALPRAIGRDLDPQVA